MTRRQRIIFLIIFAVPVLNLLVLGTIYQIPYAYPIAGLLAFTLGAVYNYLHRVRRTGAAPRSRTTKIAIQLYIAFALIAFVNISAEGWHWYDLLYLAFPTAVTALMFRSRRRPQEAKSE
jgi:peptidoglycan/LPS O-acetylase OafA/YrhL